MPDFWMNDAGTWRKAKAVWGNDGGVWRKAKEIWAKDGATWRKVFSGFTLVGGNVPADVVTLSTAPSITYQSDGTLTTTGLVGSGSWGTPTEAGVGSGFWINVAAGTGTGVMSSGTFGSWVQLSISRTWAMTAAPNGQFRSRTCPYQISSDSGGSVVVASGNLLFSSDRT